MPWARPPTPTRAAAIRERARAFGSAVDRLGRVRRHFAVKANPNGAVLATLAGEGYGADVVSGGELARALAAGVAASDVVFSGVGKTAAELAYALDAGIGCVNLESEEEGALLAELAAARGTMARAALRVNPDVGGGGHAKITTGSGDTKFGVPIEAAAATYARLAARPGLALDGLAVHIGSQLLDLAPFERAFARVGALLVELRAAGHVVTSVDLGGGLGVAAEGREPPSFRAYAAMAARATHGWDVALAFEPGRCLVADAGVLLARVVRVKAGAGPALRRAGRRHERPSPPRALRRGARGARRGPAGGRVGGGGGRPGVRDRRPVPLGRAPNPAESRRPGGDRAGRGVRRVHGVPPTTPALCPPRSWWRATAGRWCASAGPPAI